MIEAARSRLRTGLPRRAGRVVAAAALLFSVAGCMTVDGQLEVASDDTVSGAFVVAIERAALADSTTTTEEEFLAKLGEWNPVQQLPAGGRAEVQPYIADHLLGKRYVYDKVPLSEFGSGGTWRIQHVGDAYLVVGEVDFSGLAGYPGIDPAEASRGWDVSMRITFPGRVRSANGKISGRTVTWTPALAKRTRLAAEADDGSPPFTLSKLGVAGASLAGPGRWVIGAGIAGEITVAGLSAYLLWRRRRRRALALAGAGDPAYPWRTAGARSASPGGGRHRAR